MNQRPLFSVFTPTYNRAHTLDRVYNCLRAQTFRDFEWVIIDDGSTDNTKQLIQTWEKEADFPIKYHWQPNQGKHIAYNHCAKVASGELFVNIDSDDEALPNALQRFKDIWYSISTDQREGLSGIMCHCRDQKGNLVGKLFEKEVIADTLEYLLSRPNHGEKWGFLRMDVFREFPFPEDVKNVHIPETYFMHACTQKYKSKFVNDVLRVYYVQEHSDSLNEKLKKKENYAGNYYGCLAFPKFSMRLFFKFPKIFIANTAYYVKLSLFLKKGLGVQWRDIGNARGRLLWIFTWPIGLFLYAKDKVIKK